MYEYVPSNLAASPPIVVAAHYCGGSASAMYGFTGMPGIEAAADKYGFIMIFPQTTNPATSAKCWDVGSKASLTHDGGGDTQAIAEMVKYEVSKRNADSSRVYVMGASSGAMLTEAMLAVYPDVFKAGAEFSGVPAGCWSDGWSAASNWGGTCANGNDSMSAQAWGDLVRGMYPGYSGFRPRIQLWHGTSDQTINKNNQTEAIKEWTNVLGLSATPNSTDTTSVQGFTIQKWQNTCGFTVLEAHTQANGGHTTPIDSSSVVSFFGLDKTSADPQIAQCGSTGNGTAGGSAGGSGAGGNGAGGGSGGGMSSGGSTGMIGSAGNTASGGASSGGGAPSTGTAGTFGASGGAAGGSGHSGSGGAMTTSIAGSGAAGAAPSSGGGNTTGDTGSDSANGCTCRLGGAGTGTRGGAWVALLGVAFALARRVSKPSAVHLPTRSGRRRRRARSSALRSAPRCSRYPAPLPHSSCARIRWRARASPARDLRA
jgi:poly(hydroxyalkanoate) depolymerase family esterase